MFEIGDLVKMKNSDIYLLVTPKTSKIADHFSAIVLYANNNRLKIFEYDKRWEVNSFEKVNEKITFHFQNDKNQSTRRGDIVMNADILIAVSKINIQSPTFSGVILSYGDKTRIGQWVNGVSLLRFTKVESAMITL